MGLRLSTLMQTNKLLLKGHKPLLHPPFANMTQFDRLLRCVLMAYAKHQLDSSHIGWEELGDALMCEICNTIGDDAFVAWGERMRAEIDAPDIDDD